MEPSLKIIGLIVQIKEEKQNEKNYSINSDDLNRISRSC